MYAGRQTGLVVWTLGICIFVGAPDARAGDLEQMHGTWKVTYAEVGGRPATAKQLKDYQVKIAGHKFVLIEGDQTETVHMELDPSASPARLDFWRGKPSNSNKTLWHGSYAFDGGRLKMCWGPAGKSRPGGFGSKKAENRYYILTR